VSGAATGQVQIFDGDALRRLHTYYDGAAQVTALMVYYEPVGGRPRIVSAHREGALQVLDGESGALLRRLEGFDNTAWHLWAYVWVDGEGAPQQRLAVGGGRGRLHVYNPETGELLRELRGHTGGGIAALASFDPSWAPGSEPHLVVASHRSASIWDAEGGRLRHTLEGHADNVTSMCVYKEHVGGRDRVDTGSVDSDIRVFDAEDGTLIHILKGHLEQVQCLAVYEPAEGPWRLVSGSSDRGVKVWDPEAGLLLQNLENHVTWVVRLHVFESGAGRCLLASGDIWGVVSVWDLGDMAPVRAAPMRGAHKTK
jgi:WD40 repeat protein